MRVLGFTGGRNRSYYGSHSFRANCTTPGSGRALPVGSHTLARRFSGSAGSQVGAAAPGTRREFSKPPGGAGALESGAAPATRNPGPPGLRLVPLRTASLPTSARTPLSSRTPPAHPPAPRCPRILAAPSGGDRSFCSAFPHAGGTPSPAAPKRRTPPAAALGPARQLCPVPPSPPAPPARRRAAQSRDVRAAAAAAGGEMSML